MTETYNSKTGMIRIECETPDVGLARKKIETGTLVRQKYAGNRVIRYIVESEGESVEIRSMTTKLIILTKSAEAAESVKALFQ